MHIGQVVQCIDDEFPPNAQIALKERPRFLGRYTVREIVPGHRGEGLRLAEITNPEILVSGKSGIYKMEPTFLAGRFLASEPASVSVLETADSI